MRYKPGQKEETQKMLVEAAAKSFRKYGFAGIGVDGLAKEAGMTSGAFYKHFKSKGEAFNAAISAGLSEVAEAINQLQEEHGEKWWKAFAEVYMEDRRCCDPKDTCSLQALSPEAMRADTSTKAGFEQALLQIAAAAARGAPDSENYAEIWPKLAMLIGGLTLARAVKSEAVSSQIANSIKAKFEY